MKKFASLVLALVLFIGLTACAGTDKTPETTTDSTAKETVSDESMEDESKVDKTEAEETSEAESKDEDPSADAVGQIEKMGLGIYVDLEKSKASEESTLARADATIAGVGFDKDGKIVKVTFDEAQNSVPVEDGKLAKADKFVAKKELGKDYGMAKASSIEKEWFEQAEFLEEYFVGKTADEIAKLEVDDSSKSTDPDLLSGATIKLNVFQNAIMKAWENAEDVENVQDISLGIISSLGKDSKDADDKNGAVVQFNDVITLIGLDGEGKITASKTDMTENTIRFTADGKLDGKYTAGVTKRDLGKDYGMDKASSIKKDWFEQIDAYDAYITGKTFEEVSQIELDKDGKATDPDLISGATLSLDVFKKATEKAIANAK